MHPGPATGRGSPQTPRVTPQAICAPVEAIQDPWHPEQVHGEGPAHLLLEQPTVGRAAVKVGP